MRVPTIEAEYIICAQLARNRDEAAKRCHQLRVGEMFAKAIQKPESRAEVILQNMKCIVCGVPMKARRSSKKTCSVRCRLRLSRIRRATMALPEAEQTKRAAELNKRWRREQREVERMEKRKPKQSLKEIEDDIRATMAAIS